MPQYEKTVIVGVGLLGGSIGLALRKLAMSGQIHGVGRNEQALLQARELGAITHISQNLKVACEAADLVVVCTPVQSIGQFVNRCLECNLSHNCLLTDVGRAWKHLPTIVFAARILWLAATEVAFNTHLRICSKDD